jgi:peptidoglycan-N-acetylglucosamine deacetylase
MAAGKCAAAEGYAARQQFRFQVANLEQRGGERDAVFAQRPRAFRRCASRNHDYGVSLDFEQIPPAQMQNFVALVSDLSRRLHADKRVLDLSVPSDDDDYPYRALAAAADHLIVMAYDEHAINNPAGPIASLGWFEKILDRRFKDMDASKLVVALGSYGYDWPGKGDGHEVTVQEAWQAAQDSQATVSFDQDSLNPTFAYDEDGSGHHTVWFLDAASAFNEMDAALSMRPGGVALWRLGSEDPSV